MDALFFLHCEKISLQKYIDVTERKRKNNRLTKILSQVTIKTRLLFNILTNSVLYGGRGGKEMDKSVREKDRSHYD